jgi:DNA-binding MarR family transcriptional regulator
MSDGTQFVNQITFLRNGMAPDITGLAMAMFIEVATHKGGVPVSRLLEKFELSASTGSRNIYLLSSGLVRTNDPGRKGLGLIRTERPLNDRRSLMVFLTPKGQQLAKAFREVK